MKMKTRTLVIALLSACSVLAVLAVPPVKKNGQLINQEGHTVQLSTGEVVKVAIHEEIAVDWAKKKSVGGRNIVLFESSTGTRIAMHSVDSAKRVRTTIWSVDGPDKLSFDVDLAGENVPLVVEINGEREIFSVDKGDRGEDERVRSGLRNHTAKMSPAFRDALRELFLLGRAGYPGLGTGHADLGLVLDPGEISVPSVSISSKSPLTKAELTTLFKDSSPTPLK
jgi:hypothetical protein